MIVSYLNLESTLSDSPLSEFMNHLIILTCPCCSFRLYSGRLTNFVSLLYIIPINFCTKYNIAVVGSNVRNLCYSIVCM